MLRAISLVSLTVGLLVAGAAEAQTKLMLEPVFGGTRFDRPLALKQVPGETGRYVVIEQDGRVLLLEGLEDTAADVVLDIRSRVDDGPNEAGLLGLAFHPKFADNGRVFLSYTRRGDSRLESVVAAFTMNTETSAIDSNSEQLILSVPQPFGNHNGGDIAFGPDGYLYIGFGDGGAGGDPLDHGQNLTTLLGAILRIDVDGGSPYGIPRDNPFRQRRDARAEIYAYGLRNPWRFSFDRETGALWAADVGQNKVEEVNVIVAGGNYGWNIREGANAFRDRGRSAIGLIDPVAQYGRDLGCSVTGGYVYRGQEMPDLRGTYLFADYCSGRFWGVRTSADGQRVVQEVLRADIQPASFGEGSDGTLFVMDLDGTIYKIGTAP
ncbi:MAG: PQQ-dependent sugar dehydrogenase [Alphaproteobacteria bacterium]